MSADFRGKTLQALISTSNYQIKKDEETLGKKKTNYRTAAHLYKKKAEKKFSISLYIELHFRDSDNNLYSKRLKVKEKCPKIEKSDLVDDTTSCVIFFVWFHAYFR